MNLLSRLVLILFVLLLGVACAADPVPRLSDPLERSVPIPLRVEIVGEGILSDELTAQVGEQLRDRGIEVATTGPTDARVVVRSGSDSRSGSIGDVKAWRFVMRLQVFCRSPLGGDELILMDRRFAPTEASLGSDEELEARKALSPFVDQAADLAAQRLKACGDPAARMTMTVHIQRITDRTLFDQFIEELFARRSAVGLVGIGGQRFDPPTASFDLVLDSRGAGGLGAVLEEIRLQGPRSIDVLREDGSNVWIRIHR